MPKFTIMNQKDFFTFRCRTGALLERTVNEIFSAGTAYEW